MGHTHDKPQFKGGRNIAMKVPPHLFNKTVSFYRDLVGLKTIEPETVNENTVLFEFGAIQLWIDRVESVSQPEIWLELVVDDVRLASEYLETAGVVRCDEIEPLPHGFPGFWITSPALIIHMVKDNTVE
jgi:hypothetical protein